jgi:hypothetical protein
VRQRGLSLSGERRTPSARFERRPQIFKHEGRVFSSIRAASPAASYKLGLLELKHEAIRWTGQLVKHPEPCFNEPIGFIPGTRLVVKSPNGRGLDRFYHAKVEPAGQESMVSISLSPGEKMACPIRSPCHREQRSRNRGVIV